MKVDKTDDEWRKQLSPEQFRVLREKGTETPFSGELYQNTKTGDYKCGACDNLLFKSEQKYHSDMPGLAGWPSFSDVAGSDAVQLVPDDSGGMHRTEVVCKSCGGHLGHLFDDPESPTAQHYCINSLSLKFDPDK